jgi:DNA-binding LytR/AlgR family response regulator
MKKVLIVEDEFSIALDLELYLQELGYQVVGIADHYEQAIEMMQTQKPDIILMDIHIKGAKTGIEVAKTAHQNHHIPVIFLSALADSITIDDAMQTEPFGYLTKPFKEIDLRNLLAIASHQSELLKLKEQELMPLWREDTQKVSFQDTFFVKDKSKLIAVRVADILWIEALENYSVIMLKEQKIIANMLLKDIAEKLPPTHFFRVHRSYVIALDKIRKLEDGYIYITDTPIPLSKGHREELLQKIKIF